MSTFICYKNGLKVFFENFFFALASWAREKLKILECERAQRTKFDKEDENGRYHSRSSGKAWFLMIIRLQITTFDLSRAVATVALTFDSGLAVLFDVCLF